MIRMIALIKNLKMKERWTEYALLLFCVFLPFQFALNPVAGVDLAIARIIIPLLFISWIIIEFKKGNLKNYWELNTKIILFFLLLSFFSITYSKNIEWSFRKTTFLFSIIPIYWVSLFIFKKNNERIIRALIYGSFGLALIGLIQFVSQFIFSINTVYDFLAKKVMPFFLGQSFSNMVTSYPSWLVNSQGATYMRAVGLFPDPHMLSYYLGMLIPWAIAFAIKYKDGRALFIVITLVLIVTDIFTFTRGSYIALVGSSLISFPLVNSGGKKLLLLTAALFIALTFLVPNNPVSSRFTSSFDAQEGSNKARLSNWQQATQIIKENPLGVGIGMYPLAVDPNATYRQPIYAHNLYLDIAAEMGILAAITFIFILLTAFLIFWKAARKDYFYVAGVASISIFSIQSLVETPLYSVHVLPLLFVILALAAALKKYEFVSN